MIFRVRTVCGIYPHTVIQFPGFTLKFCPVYGVQFSYFLRQTLTKDPQQVWQTLKNFDYPEFVIMLNTTDDQLIQKIIKSAKKNFVTENEKNDKPYQLSASMGYAITNLSNETIDDFMNRIDEQMYQDKMKYYEHNDRRNSK